MHLNPGLRALMTSPTPVIVPLVPIPETAVCDVHGRILALLALDSHLEALARGHRRTAGRYSPTLTPEPPISFGTSFIFGSPSLMCSFVS